MWVDNRIAWPVDDRHQLVTVAVHKPGHYGKRRVSVAIFGDDLQWHFVRSKDKACANLRVLAWQPLPNAYDPPRTKRREIARDVALMTRSLAEGA